MQFIDKVYEHTYEINKSKFISFLCPYNAFSEVLHNLKEEHPKASHYVWAYRYSEFNMLYEKANDDGEPKGCAGKPVLNILQKLDFINTANIVVRYFGGVKLGAGGLIRAYSTSTKEVINISNPRVFEKKEKTSIKINIKNLNIIKHHLKEFDIIDIHINYTGEIIDINISAKKDLLYSFILEMKSRNLIIKS